MVVVVELIVASKMTACHPVLKSMILAATKDVWVVIEGTHMVEAVSAMVVAENNHIVLAKIKARLDKASSYRTT